MVLFTKLSIIDFVIIFKSKISFKGVDATLGDLATW